MSDYFKKRMEELGLSDSGKSSSNGKTSTVKSESGNQTGSSDYFAKRIKELGQDKNGVNDDYVSSFLNDAKKYVDEGTGLNSRLGVGTSSDIYKSRKETADDLRSRSWAISKSGI